MDLPKAKESNYYASFKRCCLIKIYILFYETKLFYMYIVNRLVINESPSYRGTKICIYFLWKKSSIHSTARWSNNNPDLSWITSLWPEQTETQLQFCSMLLESCWNTPPPPCQLRLLHVFYNMWHTIIAIKIDYFANEWNFRSMKKLLLYKCCLYCLALVKLRGTSGVDSDINEMKQEHQAMQSEKKVHVHIHIYVQIKFNIFTIS